MLACPAECYPRLLRSLNRPWRLLSGQASEAAERRDGVCACHCPRWSCPRSAASAHESIELPATSTVALAEAESRAGTLSPCSVAFVRLDSRQSPCVTCPKTILGCRYEASASRVTRNHQRDPPARLGSGRCRDRHQGCSAWRQATRVQLLFAGCVLVYPHPATPPVHSTRRAAEAWIGTALSRPARTHSTWYALPGPTHAYRSPAAIAPSTVRRPIRCSDCSESLEAYLARCLLPPDSSCSYTRPPNKVFRLVNLPRALTARSKAPNAPTQASTVLGNER